MQLCLLHFDDAFDAQKDFVRACEHLNAMQLRACGGKVRLWGKHADLQAFKQQGLNLLNDIKKPCLCFMGSGDFHHITPFLLDAALAPIHELVTVIHFDNHPDWVKFGKGTHCGSWVNRALEHQQVQKVITIGVCSHDLRSPEWKGANLALLTNERLELYPYHHPPSRVRKQYGANACYEQKNNALHWNNISAMGEQNFLEFLLSRIATPAVYFTIDKDVLAREDAVTNWDQGRMRLPYLLTLIQEISRTHRIIGADVTGDYSTPYYTGNAWEKLVKKAEIYMDQPRTKPDTNHAANINSAANHALLEVLSEAMG